MGKFIRWPLIFIAALVLTAIFEPPLMEMFRSWGWHDRPEQIAGDVLNWMVRLVGETAFPWIASGTLGLTVGVWLNYFAMSFDKRSPTKAEIFEGKRSSIVMTSIALRDLVEHWKYYSTSPDEQGQWPADIFGKVYALRTDLKKLKIELPRLELIRSEESYVEKCSGLINFLDVISELANHGHLDEARSAGKDFTKSFNAKFLN